MRKISIAKFSGGILMIALGLWLAYTAFPFRNPLDFWFRIAFGSFFVFFPFLIKKWDEDRREKDNRRRLKEAAKRELAHRRKPSVVPRDMNKLRKQEKVLKTTFRAVWILLAAATGLHKLLF